MQSPGACVRQFVAAFVLCFVAGRCAAQPADPRALVDETIESLRDRVVAEQSRVRQDPDYAFGIVSEMLAPHIDVRLAGRLVLGRHWRTASEAQRVAFVDGLRRLLLRIFALHISDYTDAEVKLGRTEFSGEQQQRAKVRTEVSRGGSPTVTVDYRLHRVDGVWKVYDVGIFGVSIVKTYRLTIDADIREHGLDGVIEQINAMSPLSRSAATAPDADRG